PECNIKIKIASLIAPAVILQHYPSIFIQILCKYTDQLELILKRWKFYEIPYAEIIAHHGYPSETHHVTTEDGYILTIHRIPHGISGNGAANRTAVFIMHALSCSSAEDVELGPERGLGFILADAGYDVWLGNARGNAYCRNHTTLDVVADAEQFLDFSWHEIGYYDLPASIDYILNLKSDDSLYYVGTSQGTTAFLVLATSKPEYNDKIRLASLMAPAAIMNHKPDTNFLKVLCKYIDQVEALLKKYKIFEIPLTDAIRENGPTFCLNPNFTSICEFIFAQIAGNAEDAEYNKVRNFSFLQGGFSWFDYGTEKNMELYGTETPPVYDFSKIAAPTAFYYAKNDGLIPYEDEVTLISKLPNVVKDYLVPSDRYKHVSFGLAKDVVEMVYTILGILLTSEISSSKLPADSSDVGLNTVQIIENHGYVCESHYITTEDGYILTVHRIPHGINDDGTTKRPAAFLMHGLTSSSADYVNMGPERSLSYLLADAGYDVWIGNARGNAWGRNHTTLDVTADAEQFFDFSWHEIGYYDVAASIDYILNLNGDDSLYYVGHSQGTTAFLVLATTRPEYNDKIRVASLMAPAAILEHRPFNLVQDLCKYIDKVELLLKRYKIYEIPFTESIRKWGMTNCVNPDYFDTCNLLFSLIGGTIDEKEFDTAMIPVIATNAPSNAGMKQYVHYGQQIKHGGFSQFDFGAEENMKKYGTETPPPYDFSKISAPVAVYYAVNDGVVPYEDVQTIISQLPNVANDYVVPYDNFNHVAFVYATDILDLVYNELMNAMEATTIITILSLLSIYEVSSSTLPQETSDVGLNTVQIIENHGYVCETHYITTEDGYILTFHRIPHGINDDGAEKRPAVLLMHGLISSSADYVNMGPDRSLAYLLADAGYDVWIGNGRGNAWSRNHTSLDIVADAEQFFNFSWHEMGYYDLPASIDYILNSVGDDSLHYVGHSQGCTAFIVLTTTRPEYNDKIKIASLMAPASFMEHRPFGLVTDLAKYIYEIEALFEKYKIFEIPFTEVIREWAMTNCGNPDFYGICEFVLNEIGGGADTAQIDVELMAVIGTNAPSNAAIKQLIHYGQQIKNGGFSSFDYGADKNMEIYGTETPPAYDWSKISAPVAVYYGKNDGLVPYEDVLNIISKLPNVVNDYLVPLDLFNHIDFIFAKDVVDLLYNELMAVMQKY
ncbi:Abhydro lipase domain containing protein, partial [Asbolus verrucosus]